ncbi:unannotated protein [freshwater metagenome]|uniref:Unannotated protein n=1 Tax=freshwater metagenome TaxID=449393 RepID=A0A6J7RMY3_9ZZZZ
MGLVNQPEGFNCALGAVLRVSLVGECAIDIETGDINFGLAVNDPVRNNATDATTGEDANRVHAGGNKIVADAWCFADERL